MAHGGLLLFSVFALLPFVSIILISLYPESQPAAGLGLPRSLNFGNYADAWVGADMGSVMKSSVIVAAFVVPIGSVLCIMAGYAFGTMRFRFNGILSYVFVIGLVLPFEATVIPLYYDERLFGLANTYPGLILPETALFMSFGTLWMRTHFASAQRELVDAARLDGCNSWQVLWLILVPSARAPIATMVVLFFTWSWNEFLLPLVLAQTPDTETAPAALGQFVGEHITRFPLLTAAAVIVTAPVALVYVLMQRQFVRGVTAGAVTG